MPNLISVARARMAFPNVLDASQDPLINTLIPAATVSIEAYCKRSFHQADYDELYDSTGGGSILLRNFPVVKVKRVAQNPLACLQIRNTATSTNSRATVATTLPPNADWPTASTGLILSRVASGVETIDANVTWLANATVQAVATAINALGNGWTASVQNNLGSWAASDINAIQGAYTAFGAGAKLTIHSTEATDWTVIPDRGELIFSGVNGGLFGPSWGNIGRNDPYLGTNIPAGLQNVRIQYTAGFASVPEDVQQACALLVQYMWQQPTMMGNLVSEKLGDYSYERYVPIKYSLPDAVIALLAPYREHRA